MDVFKVLNNDIGDLSEEERVFAERFNKLLRDKLIDELAENEMNELIKDLKNNEEHCRVKLMNVFVNGKKGYIKMPTKTLIDIYLDRKDEGEFINLLESISDI